MKRKRPIFGHVEVDFRFEAILARAFEEFQAADAEFLLLEKKPKAAQAPNHLQSLFAARNRRIEAGVVAIVAAGPLLERTLDSYAKHFLDEKFYKNYIRRQVSLLSKWILVPRLCEGKEIDPEREEIKALRTFLNVRNSIVHPDREIIDDTFQALNKNPSQKTDQLYPVCRHLRKTVESLVQMLKSK